MVPDDTHQKVSGFADADGVTVVCSCGYSGDEEDVDAHIASVGDDE